MDIEEIRRRGAAGFTLLEILIALSICAIALTILFQLFASSLRNISVSEDRVYAAARTYARIKEIQNDPKLPDKTWTEVWGDGYHAEIAITEHMKEKMGEIPVKLMEIHVTVHWKKGSKAYSYDATTLKLIGRDVSAISGSDS